MKVLFVSSWYPTPENPNYGIFIQEHAKAIQSTSNEIHVFAVVVLRSKAFLDITFRQYVDDWGIRTSELILYSRFRDLIYHLVPLQNWMANYYFKKHIAAHFTPDIIHSNVIFPAGMLGDYFARKYRKPHIISEHWSKIGDLLNKRFLSSMAKSSYLRANKILPVSAFLRNRMMQLIPNLSSDSFTIIPNVIESDLFTYQVKQSSEDEIHFCAIATWASKRVPDKKPEFFMNALNTLQQKTSKRIKLTMVGGGNRVMELKNKSEAMDIEIDFVGHQTKKAIVDILHNSDFFIHASRIETFGVVIVEALMTGTPVICSNVGALPELVDDASGVLCENTPEAWIAGIEKAMNTMFDTQYISERVMTEFSIKKIGEKIADVYETLI